MLETKIPIIIMEQKSLCSYNYNFHPKIKHIIIDSNDDVIEKSKLINKSVSYINTESLWINDADI